MGCGHGRVEAVASRTPNDAPEVLLPRCRSRSLPWRLAARPRPSAAPFAYVAIAWRVVSVIDRATHTVVKTIEVGPAPMATAVHPDAARST